MTPDAAGSPARRSETWFRYGIAGVVFGGCLAAFVGRQYLSWDASYQLFFMLQWDRFFIFKDRWTMQLFQLPVRAVHAVTDDLSLLIDAYGLFYSFVPAICVASVARILRSRTDLFVLSVVGICASTLLFQYHWLAEHLIACQVEWVLLALLVRDGRTAASIAALALTAAVVFLLHPVASVLLGLAAVFALARDFRSARSRVVAIGLAVLSIARAAMLTGSPDDRRYLDLERILSALAFDHPIADWFPRRDLPLLYMVLISSVALLPLVPAMRRRDMRWLRWVVLAAAGACLFAWLHGDPRSLAYGLRIRHVTVFACLVPYGGFMWLALRTRSDGGGTTMRSPAGWLSPTYGLAVALMFVAFLTDVSVLRQRQLAAADAWLRGSRADCRPMLSYARRHPTFLEHWAMTYEVVLYNESRRPSALFVDREQGCDFRDSGKYVQLTRFAVGFPRSGYFDLTEVIPPRKELPSQ